jgi:hypothetical protein
MEVVNYEVPKPVIGDAVQISTNDDDYTIYALGNKAPPYDNVIILHDATKNDPQPSYSRLVITNGKWQVHYYDEPHDVTFLKKVVKAPITKTKKSTGKKTIAKKIAKASPLKKLSPRKAVSPKKSPPKSDLTRFILTTIQKGKGDKVSKVAIKKELAASDLSKGMSATETLKMLNDELTSLVNKKLIRQDKQSFVIKK